MSPTVASMIEGLLQPLHLIIILAIALIVLGPKRLPEAGRGIGEAMRGFRESIAGKDADDELERPAARPTVSASTRVDEDAPEA